MISLSLVTYPSKLVGQQVVPSSIGHDRVLEAHVHHLKSTKLSPVILFWSLFWPSPRTSYYLAEISLPNISLSLFFFCISRFHLDVIKFAPSFCRNSPALRAMLNARQNDVGRTKFEPGWAIASSDQLSFCYTSRREGCGCIQWQIDIRCSWCSPSLCSTQWFLQ